MDNNIIIRKAVPEDAPAILDIVKRAFKVYQAELSSGIKVAALNETIDQTLFDIENQHVYAAFLEDGTIAGTIRFESLNSDLAYIYRFGVDPDINNSGIGSELINRAIADCVEMGFKAITLHTNAKYYKLARYYYGREFYVHSTDMSKGYIRALFVKDLSAEAVDLTPAFKR